MNGVSIGQRFPEPLATRRCVHLAYFLRANRTKARYELPCRLTVLRSMADIIVEAFFVPLMPPPCEGE